ncbi:RodZ domain-containing protein [Pseudoalteromonas mariniglutinosa]|uniref:RodZ domain-containing protein n=1 Tax=Pseudoalteromonas mariniglutinosa TaxID=206042 RepID=UPI00384D7C5E
MNEENNTEQQATLGQVLKQHRENANISLEQLAKTLKLSVLQLQRLENDEHHLLGPTTFVKGYAKSYCRALNIDSQTIITLFPESVQPNKRANMQSFSKRTEKEAHDNRLMLVSYIILAIILGSSALWWWQNTTPIDQQSNTLERANQSQSEQQANRQSVISEIQQSATPDVQQAESMAMQNPPSVNDTETLSIQTVAAPVDEANNTLPAPAETAQSTIVMQFDEPSWVEIHDASGERVAFGVKKAGYTMTVTGISPFSVVLGKHQAVDITLDGEKIDISSFPKNRLAKFNLPLTE